VRFPVAWKVPAGASPPLGVHGSTGAALNASLPGHCISRTHLWFPTQLQMKSCVVCAAWSVSDRQKEGDTTTKRRNDVRRRHEYISLGSHRISHSSPH